MKTYRIETWHCGSAAHGEWTSDADMLHRISQIVHDDVPDGIPNLYWPDDPVTFSGETPEDLLYALYAQMVERPSECHLLIYGLRRYAEVRDAMGLRETGNDWTPFGVDDLDSADAEDYDELCTTVGEVFGDEAERTQREALREVLTEQDDA